MHAKKRLGQNFLVGSHYPDRILSAVAPTPEDVILEVGPGHGAITGGLLASGARVIAIEIDRELIPELQARFMHEDRLQLIEADALEADFCAIISPASTARVVANLPYYIATPILQRMIAQRSCISEMTLMLQKEVVERIIAPPGGRDYGFISALVQLFCTPERLFDVPAGAFRPVPKVVSSVIRLRVRPDPMVDRDDEAYVIELLKTLFAQRRKNILNNLKAGRERLSLGSDESILRATAAVEIDSRRRGETLTLNETIALARSLRGSASNSELR